MKFSFDIQTPSACVNCPFHTVETDKITGKWVMRCMINKKIPIEMKGGLEKRSDQCPGIVEEGE